MCSPKETKQVSTDTRVTPSHKELLGLEPAAQTGRMLWGRSQVKVSSHSQCSDCSQPQTFTPQVL